MRLMISKPNNDEEYLNSLPPGFRFNPTDVELCFYLWSKIHGKQLPPNRINVVKLYDYDPPTLTAMSDNELFDGTRTEWYFFTPQNRKYPNGGRPERAAGDGFWKATSAGKRIEKDKNTLVGLKKTLVYYKGKPPKGVKTNWIMHEYVLDNPTPRTRTGPNDMRLNDWVLCRVYEREGSEKKRQKSGIVNPETPLLVTEQNQEIVENPMANANEAVTREYASPFPLLQSQHFQGQDHNFSLMPEQTNSEMGFNSNGAIFDDFTNGGLPQFPQPCHDISLDMLDHWVDNYNLNVVHDMPIVPSDGSLTWTAVPPMITGTASDDQLHWVDHHNNMDIHQIATGSNYGGLIVTPVSSIPPNDRSHRVDKDNLNMHQTTANYDSLTAVPPKSLMPPDDKQT